MLGVDDVQARIVAALQAVAGKDLQIVSETNIARDLGLDSLAIMNFIMRLEDEFDLSIPLERIPDIETVADLASTIRELKAKA